MRPYILTILATTVGTFACGSDRSDFDGRSDSGPTINDLPDMSGAPDVAIPVLDGTLAVEVSTDASISNCLPGAKRCRQNLAQECQANGDWGEPFSCGLGVCLEDTGECDTRCSPGQKECNGRYIIECNAKGNGWDTGDLCEFCCDPDLHACVAETIQCYSGPPGTLGVGACSPGHRPCSAGPASQCFDETLPTSEICNGNDDDCDGLVDEGLETSCFEGDPAVVGIGSCREGVRQCVGGEIGPCQGFVGPVAESCNGTDDDCNGTVDEALSERCFDGDPQVVGIGECRDGVRHCDNGSPGGCEGQILPHQEICNRLDDDCDGAVDEDFEFGNDVENCGGCGQVCQVANAVPVCAAGHCGATDCIPGFEDCTGDLALGPDGDGCETHGPCPIGDTDRTCDGRDDDQDGQTDEDFVPQLSCGRGQCRLTAIPGRCLNGSVESCQPGEAAALDSICDGLDEDCDGQIDEEVPALAGCGVGACAVLPPPPCVDGTPNRCVPRNPVPERCNMVDDDCDGVVDNGLGLGDECVVGIGACRATGVISCDAGGGTRCSVSAIQPETLVDEECNGIDDDCDGELDEDFVSDATCGVGLCADGFVPSRCVDGDFTACTPGITPPEVEQRCDGVDDDCDGSSDEDFPVGTPCSTGVGRCRRNGSYRCAPDGSGADCVTVGAPAPAVDTSCNGIDDDCDGAVDDEYQTVLSCGRGVCETNSVASHCLNGVERPCEAGTPDAEVCDGLDNDCDGVIDDTNDCPPGTACLSGACRPTDVGWSSFELYDNVVVLDEDNGVEVAGANPDDPCEQIFIAQPPAELDVGDILVWSVAPGFICEATFVTDAGAPIAHGGEFQAFGFWGGGILVEGIIRGMDYVFRNLEFVEDQPFSYAVPFPLGRIELEMQSDRGLQFTGQWDPTGTQMELDGNIHFEFIRRDGETQRVQQIVHATRTTTERHRFEVIGGIGGGDDTVRHDSTRILLRPREFVTVMVGPVPVSLLVGLDASFRFSIQGGATAEFRSTTETEYYESMTWARGSGFAGTFDVTRSSPSGPSVSANLLGKFEAEVSLEPYVDVRVARLLGPTFRLKGKGRAGFEYGFPPAFPEVYLEVLAELAIQAKLDFFGDILDRTISLYAPSDWKLLEYRRRLSQCNGGSCCTVGENPASVLPSSRVCGQGDDVRYTCSVGGGCGGNVYQQTSIRYCSGRSAGCDGAMDWGQAVLLRTCRAGERCVDGRPDCVADAQCDLCGAANCPVCTVCDGFDGDCRPVNDGTSCNGSGACRAGICCQRHATKWCDGNSVRWYDSCGRAEEIFEQCNGGAQCANGSCSCSPNVRVACFAGDVHSFDSCGNPGPIVDDCAGQEICETDECLCQADVRRICVGNDVYAVDACGNRSAQPVLRCQAPQVCQNGACVGGCAGGAEIADYVDNNCNGTVDEGFQRQIHRFVQLCISAHWQSDSSTCAPHPEGMPGCLDCAQRAQNGCATPTCWDLEEARSFRTYSAPASGVVMDRIFHCYNEGSRANRYSRNRAVCSRDGFEEGIPVDIGYLARNAPPAMAGLRGTPVWQCVWNRGQGNLDYFLTTSLDECRNPALGLVQYVDPATDQLTQNATVFGYAFF